MRLATRRAPPLRARRSYETRSHHPLTPCRAASQERYAAELCWELLEEFGIFEYYKSTGSASASVEGESGPETVSNVVIGCAWKPPRPLALLSGEPMGPAEVAATTEGREHGAAAAEVVSRYGLEIPKLLHQLERLQKDKWIRVADLLSTVRNTHNLLTGEKASDALRAALALLHAFDMGPSMLHLGASPKIVTLIKLLTDAALVWLASELKRLGYWTDDMASWTVPPLVAALRLSLATIARVGMPKLRIDEGPVRAHAPAAPAAPAASAAWP